MRSDNEAQSRAPTNCKIDVAGTVLAMRQHWGNVGATVGFEAEASDRKALEHREGAGLGGMDPLSCVMVVAVHGKHWTTISAALQTLQRNSIQLCDAKPGMKHNNGTCRLLPFPTP